MSYPVVLKAECDHRWPKGTSWIHAGSGVRNLKGKHLHSCSFKEQMLQL